MAQASRGVMLVTGGSRGIGAAVVRLALTRGYEVAINYQRQAAPVEALAAEAAALGRKAVALQADVQDPDAVAGLFDAAEAALGPRGRPPTGHDARRPRRGDCQHFFGCGRAGQSGRICLVCGQQGRRR